MSLVATQRPSEQIDEEVNAVQRKWSVPSVLTAMVLVAGWWPAVSAADDDCDAWFPDLQCERSGRYAGFVPTMVAPYLFEDPFVVTGMNLVAVWNDLPGRSVFRGGDVRVAASQIRIAVTDRLGFYAAKDGFVSLRPELNLLDTERGQMDLGAGLKYALIDRPDDRFILTPMIGYEMTTGSSDVFSGHGEGQWVPAVSAAWGVGRFQLVGAVGARLPVDGDRGATSASYHLHVDFAASNGFQPFLSLTGIRYLDDGRGENRVRLGNGTSLPLGTVQQVLGTGGFEGNDVLNLGSDNVKGNDIVNLGVGFQKKLTSKLMLGVAYEHPVTRRKDLVQQRVSLMLTFEM